MHINYDAFADVLGTNPKERLLEQNRTGLCVIVGACWLRIFGRITSRYRLSAKP
jgi:hypothetical protein